MNGKIVADCSILHPRSIIAEEPIHPHYLLTKTFIVMGVFASLVSLSACFSVFCLQGVTFPAMMSMWARWAPPLERARLMNLSGSGANFGAFLALPLTAYICQTLGWPAVFYVCGEGEKHTDLGSRAILTSCAAEQLL